MICVTSEAVLKWIQLDLSLGQGSSWEVQMGFGLNSGSMGPHYLDVLLLPSYLPCQTRDKMRCKFQFRLFAGEMACRYHSRHFLSYLYF